MFELLPRTLARAAYRSVQRWRRSRHASLDRLFFLHLPKCGGSSVDAALQKVYRERGLSIAYLNPQASLSAAELIGEPVAAFRSRLLFYHMVEKRNRYISGHFPYDERAWRIFGAEWCFLTLLREPVARWLSHYFYDRYKTGSDHSRINEPIDAFLESPRAIHQGRNYVTTLAGEIAPEKAAEPESIRRAVENLERFAVVGALERMDTFARDCSELLRLDIEVGHERKNPRKPSEQREEITEPILERVRALCAPNIRVYDAVLSRIDEQGSWLERNGAAVRASFSTPLG